MSQFVIAGFLSYDTFYFHGTVSVLVFTTGLKEQTASTSSEMHRVVNDEISLPENFCLPSCSSQDPSDAVDVKKGGFKTIFLF